MASPHVAGVAAMVESLGVTNAASVREALTASARRPAEDHDNNLFGAGIVDASAAVRRVFWTHFALRVVALIGLVSLVASRLRKRGKRLVRSPFAVLGALVAGTGLLPFAPLLGFSAYAGGTRTFFELLILPLGQWDLVLLGAGTHKWLLLSTALPALTLAALGFTNARARFLMGGVAVGTAAFLAQLAWSGDEAFVAGTFLFRFWAVANGLVCLWLARLALEEERP